MNVLIYKDGKYLDITSDIVSEISINERIDEVLDSGKFNLLTSHFKNAIEPFTRFVFETGDDKIIPFFAKSTCSKYMTSNDLYYHDVELYEPTKILECWILGTKSFSIIQGKENYNSNYDRIRIIVDLISQKYDVRIALDKRILNMSIEREYSFGAGTTAWDALFEIMKTEGCIPRIAFDMNSSKNEYLLTCDDIEALNSSNVHNIDNIISIFSDQSVDDYCSTMEAEYSEVVDRDTVQTAVLSCRSQGDAIYKDTACLITPSKIEKLKDVKLLIDPVKTMGTKIVLLNKKSVDDALALMNSSSYSHHFDTDNIITSFFFSTENNLSFIKALEKTDYDSYLEFKRFLNNECYVTDTDINIGDDQMQQSVITSWLFIMKDSNVNVTDGFKDYYNSYYLCVFFNETAFKTVEYSNKGITANLKSISLIDYTIPKAKWDMLDAPDKPKYLYWESGQNYIEGFYNTYNDDFWKKIIYGKVDPFIPQLKTSIADAYRYEAQYYWYHFEEAFSKIVHGKILYITQSIPMISCVDTYDYNLMRYDQIVKAIDDDFTKYAYEVKYYTKSPAFLKADKSNYNCQIATSRSYNSGATTVDYNQLVPGIKRAVDMLGLPIKTITSKTDIKLGTRTQYGYIISKNSTYKKTEQYEYKSFVYNCCDNYQQIAAAIGVDSQYEATNLPQTGIVDRFIYLEGVSTLDGDNTYLALKVNPEDSFYIAKPMQKIEVDNHKLLICEAIDNYTFDYQKAETASDNYFLKKAIQYSDSMNFVENYSDSQFILLKTKAVDVINKLPIILAEDMFELSKNSLCSKRIYKDPRERLIFVFKI